MQKILVVFICLIFSNATFAIPGWLGFSSDKTRCKVSYTQLNLITGIEIVKKHTTQRDDTDNFDTNCSDAVSNLSDKIEEWMKKSRLNIMSNITAMYCKSRSKDGIFSNEWSSYKKCYIGDSQSIAIIIDSANKNQIGYNAHPCRLLETTQEDIDNSPFCR
jgi:hypothetical protein